MTPPLQVRAISTSQALAIRHPVLRPGLPVETATFAQDDDAATFHLGAYEAGRLFSVITFFPEAYDRRPGVDAYRLRGMATLPAWRERGGASALVLEGVKRARESGARLIWCHARVGARGFYERFGFKPEGAEFDCEHSGRHVVMVRDPA